MAEKESQMMDVEAFKRYIATLSKEDAKTLHTAMTGGVSHDTHTPERTERLFQMLADIGMWDASSVKKHTDEERIALYRQYGLEVQTPKGRSGFSENMMCAPHDGVPYCVDDHGHFFKDGHDVGLRRGIRHREMMIERHHDKIKAIYEHCTTLDQGDIWVLSGGGMELQAFFGCRKGYLAILSLSMENDPTSTEEDMARVRNKSRRLEPQFEQNEPLFKGLKIPGVKVVNFPRYSLEP